MTHKSLPSVMGDLLLRAERMAQGLETHGPWLGINHIPAEEFRRVVNQLKNADASWVAARSAKTSAQKRVSVADEALTDWLAKARLVVMLARGTKWSERWIETGFIHQGTNVPKRMELRITLAHRLVVFLALHPDFGVAFAEVTAARGRPIYERMIHTRDALELANKECTASKRQRDAAERVLRRMMRNVIVTLDSMIAPGDPRWLAFGFYWPVRGSKRKHNREPRGLATTQAEPIQLPTEIHSGSERTVAA